MSVYLGHKYLHGRYFRGNENERSINILIFVQQGVNIILCICIDVLYYVGREKYDTIWFVRDNNIIIII